MKLTEAFDLYASLVLSNSKPRAQKTEKGRWTKHLEPIVQTWELDSVSNMRLLLLRNELTRKNLSPQSVYHCLSLLRRVLNRAVEWELYPGPVPKFRMPQFDNRRVRFLMPAEAEKLLSELKKRSEIWHDLALFALSTGLRRGELLQLTPANIDIYTRNCNIFDTKNCTSRTVPLNEAAAQIAKKHLSQSSDPSTPLFLENGHSVNPYARHFREAVKACELNHGVKDRRAQVCFHTLRHTFASWLVQSSTPIVLVSKLLGHSSLKMTLRYSHLAPDQGREAVSQLPLAQA